MTATTFLRVNALEIKKKTLGMPFQCMNSATATYQPITRIHIILFHWYSLVKKRILIETSSVLNNLDINKR